MYLVDEGQVDCIHSAIDGTNFYTTVLNPGAVDNTNYYRFTCYVRIITKSKSKSNQNIKISTCLVYCVEVQCFLNFNCLKFSSEK